MTSRELARLLGVSQSTVSRAFTPGASVSAETRRQIIDSARRLGYQPNAIASILSGGKTDIVGVVVSDMHNPFYPALLDRLSQRLQENGRHSLLFSAAPGSDISEQLLLLRQYAVEAVIVLSATVSSRAAIEWAAEGRSVILINRTVPDAPVTSICCDNARGAAEIADHLYALGHRHLAYVAGRADTSTNVERESAFTQRVAELGMTLGARAAADAYSYAAGRAGALEVARAEPDAIFFANDILAVGGMDALRDECGVSVPGDVAVVGFDDIEMARWPHYSLTTVRQPMDAMVDEAVGLLAVRGDQPAILGVRRIAGELVARRSTASPGGSTVPEPAPTGAPA